MAPDDLLLIVMLSAMTLYAVLGGADFGAGVWEFSTALYATDKERRHIHSAIGPVWEANHVWLIFIVVILFNGFPIAFATLCRALGFPLLLALAGVVFRGASYVFRRYIQDSGHARATWSAIFAIASTATPFFLGAAAGSIASEDLPAVSKGRAHADFLKGWMSALAIFTGFYAVALCAYLSAVFLAREAHMTRDAELRKLWRDRAMTVGVWVGLLSAGGLAIVWTDAPHLAHGFLARGWLFVVGSAGFGVTSLFAIWRGRMTLAAIAAGGAIAAVIWGWGFSQYPVLLPPDMSIHDVKAPDRVLWWMLGVIGVGAVFLLPALVYLLALFKSEQRLEEGGEG